MSTAEVIPPAAAERALTDLAREANYVATGEYIERADIEAALGSREERKGIFG